MQTFLLYGEDITIPLELVNYNTLQGTYEKLAEKVCSEFTAQYKNKFNCIEDVIKGYMGLYEEHLMAAINAAVEDLIANNVYDVDANQFVKAHSEAGRILGFDALDIIEEQFEDILEDQAAKNAYRTSRRQNRGKWVGGGFGLEGAVKGAAKAGALNVGSGILHGTANIIGSTFSAIGASAKKSALYNDPETFRILLYAVVQDCRDVKFTLSEILRKNGMNVKPVTKDGIEKATVLFNNAVKPSFPKGKLLDVAKQLILTNPYEDEYYHLMVDKFGDEAKEVEQLAAFFNIDIVGYKEGLVKKHLCNLPVATLEEALAAKTAISDLCIKLGGVPNTVQKEIDDLIEDRKYKRIYEKFNACAKTSLEEWGICKHEMKRLTEELEVADGGKKILADVDAGILKFKIDIATTFLHNLPRTSEEDAIAAKEKLVNYCKEIDLSVDNPAIKEINGVLNQIDIDIRTVEGCEFATREMAQKANIEKCEMEALLGGPPVSKNDYQFLLTYLDSHKITPELEQIYSARYSTALMRIAKKGRYAQTYEFRKKSVLKIGPSRQGIIIHVVAYAALAVFGIYYSLEFPVALGILIWEVAKRLYERNAWRELTHNGEHELSFVLSISPTMVSTFATAEPILRIKEDAADTLSSSHKSPSMCQTCNAETSPTTKFCGKCGSKLMEE